jgi:6,7-dimethyl-8-ribityllumazine synthase
MAAPRRSLFAESIRVSGARFLLVEACFYEEIGRLLRDGAQAALGAAGAVHERIEVPGALEIPIAMAIAVDRAETSGRPFAGVIALGCVIRGETFHFEIVAEQSARSALDFAVARRLPFGNGILTVENEAQALSRADPGRGDKGGDAARAALALFAIAQMAETH